jgi:hypothetical protein
MTRDEMAAFDIDLRRYPPLYLDSLEHVTVNCDVCENGHGRLMSGKVCAKCQGSGKWDYYRTKQNPDAGTPGLQNKTDLAR